MKIKTKRERERKMSLDDEEWEWDLSAEELDNLERDALLKFATKPPPPTPPPPSHQQQPHSSHFNNSNHYFDRSPSKPIASSYSSNKVFTFYSFHSLYELFSKVLLRSFLLISRVLYFFCLKFIISLTYVSLLGFY